jgi:uncharacterized membrane protein YdjX (TVP38/TMEM64 family)
MAKGRIVRVVALISLLGVLAFIGWWLWYTPSGQEFSEHPVRNAHQWIERHRVIAPIIVIGLYILVTVLGILPVWWIQVAAGFAFGTVKGVLWSDIGASAGALAAFTMSRWLAADWFHKKVESRMVKLRALDEKLGHNGFLVVMLVRLSHAAPFGLSNYMFGLLNITARDVALGTLLGGLPSITATVMLGHDRHSFSHPRFWIILGVMNVALLIPVLLRYLRPGWFKKMGIE